MHDERSLLLILIGAESLGIVVVERRGFARRFGTNSRAATASGHEFAGDGDFSGIVSRAPAMASDMASRVPGNGLGRGCLRARGLLAYLLAHDLAQLRARRLAHDDDLAGAARGGRGAFQPLRSSASVTPGAGLER